MTERARIGKNGQLLLSPDQRRRWGIPSGSRIRVQETVEGLLVRPVDPPLQRVYVEPTTECDLDCATKLIDKKGKEAARTVRIIDVAGDLGIDLDALPDHHIDCDHAAVQALAKHLAEQVDELLAASRS